MAETNNTRKEEKKMKMAVHVASGNGVGAVVVLGGCVVIATLASISAIRFRMNRKRSPRNDRSNNEECRNQSEEQGGLRDLLQHSSPPVDGLPSTDEKVDVCATKIDTTMWALTKSLILDDNPVIDKKPTYLEILLSDNSGLASNSMIFDVKNVPKVDLLDVVQVTEVEAEDKITERSHADQLAEENPLTQLIGREEMEGNDDGETVVVEMGEEGIQTFSTNQFALEDILEGSGVITEEEQEDGLAETITKRCEELEVREEKENKVADTDKTESQNPDVEWHEVEKEAAETVKIDRVAVEDKLQVTSSNEDDDEISTDENGEEVPEAGEEGSEGTGDSSLESNAETVWPAESIQALSLELKELKINNQTLEEYRRVEVEKINEETGKFEVTFEKGKAKEIPAGNNPSVWTLFSMVILVATLQLVVPHLISPANMVKLCLIVSFVLILSHV